MHEAHRTTLVSALWHPEPVGELLDAPRGNIRVLVGPAKYQLSTGEIIEI